MFGVSNIYPAPEVTRAEMILKGNLKMLIKYLSKQDFMEEITNKPDNNLYKSIKELVESDMFSIRVFDQYQTYDTEDIVKFIRNCIETNKYNLDINVQNNVIYVYKIQS